MKAIGIVLAEKKSLSLGSLASHRNVAAMPVGGSYRAIDFALSNLSNSGIKKVAIICQHNTRSLADHISSSKWWDFGRKKSGLFLFTPYMNDADSFSFKGSADAIYQNIEFLRKSNEPYVVVTTGDQITRIDYNKIIKYHEKQKSDITMVCKDFGHFGIQNYDVVQIDENHKVVEVEEQPLDPQNTVASLGIYVFGRELLLHMLEETAAQGRNSIVKDIITRYRRKLEINAYMFEGYWKKITDIKSYHETNMDILNLEVRDALFKQGDSILTKTKDEAPAKFNQFSRIVNSVVSSGNVINGMVDHSVLCRNVVIGENSIVRNSIIMQGCIIGKGVTIENAILDKHVYVSDDKRIVGKNNKIIVLDKKSIA